MIQEIELEDLGLHAENEGEGGVLDALQISSLGNKVYDAIIWIAKQGKKIIRRFLKMCVSSLKGLVS